MGAWALVRRAAITTATALLAACASAQAAEIPESGTLDLAASADVRIGGLEELSLTGFSVSRIGDVNGDGRADVAVGAPLANVPNRPNAGAVFVLFGSEQAQPIDLANLEGQGFRIDGAAAGDGAGYSLAPAGDLNGDGRGDLVIGAPVPGGDRPGQAYVVFGKPDSGAIDLASPGPGAYRIGGAQPGDLTGFSVGSVGDLNGDGRPEILVGAPRFDVDTTDRVDAGAVFVVHGSDTATNVDLGALGAGGYRIDGEGHGWAGWSVDGSPDMNGDNLPDVLVGAPIADTPGGPASGIAYAVWGRSDNAGVDLAALGAGGFRMTGGMGRGPAAGSEDLSQADQGTTGDVDADTIGEAAGSAVASMPDANGDGRPEIAVGAQSADRGSRLSAGSVYFVHGKATPDAVDLDNLPATDGYRVDGGAAGDLTGTSVSDAGDVNGDGRRDMLVSAPLASPLSRDQGGTTYVLFGRETEKSTDLAAIGDAGFRMAGPGKGDTTSGQAVGAGDVNGDGAPDLLLGGPLARPTPECSPDTSDKPCPVNPDEADRGPRAGAAFIVYSPKPVPPPPPDPGQIEEEQIDKCVAVRNVEAIVDDSGSMSGTDPDLLRRRALQIMLSKPRNEGDVLGALEFGSQADPLFAPEPIKEEEVPALIRRLRELVDADNGGTNYNAAFASVADENPAAGARIFITDGGHNEGEYTGGHAGGPPTYVIGLDIGRRGADAKRLQRIADDTKGEYYPNVGADDLQPVIGRIDSLLNCDIDLQNYPDTLEDTDEEQDHDTELDDGTYSSDVTLSWDDPGDDLDLDEIVYRRGNRKIRIGARTIKRVLKSGKPGFKRGLRISGRRGATYVTLRVTGLQGGRLKVKVGATKLSGKGHAVTQVTQSRRRH